MAAKKKLTFEWRNKKYTTQKELFTAVRQSLRNVLVPPVEVTGGPLIAQKTITAKIQLKLSNPRRSKKQTPFY